jgi:uncharacterized protein (TIRG00374 family)
LLGLIVSLATIYFIVSQIDLILLGEAIRSARWIYALPCVALLVIGLFARAMRWRLLLSNALPFWRIFHIMNVAYLVNGILPLRIGEVARVYLAYRAEPPIPPLTTTSTIVVERLLDLLSVVMLIGLALMLGDVPLAIQSVGGLVSVMVILGFGVLVLLVNRQKWAFDLLGIVERYIPFMQRLNLKVWLKQLLDGLTPLTHFYTLSGAVFWSITAWAFSLGAGYILMYTFYPTASLSTTALYIAAAALAIAVPATVGSLGVYEASILLALQSTGYGEPYSVAVAFAVTVHFVNVFVHAITGMIGFMAEGITLGQLSDGVQQINDAPTQELKREWNKR